MKISEKWLREFVNPNLDSAALAETITLAGLEVDSMDRAGPALPGVVIGEIVDIAPHPDADRLRVCQVACGADAPLQIVCGAPNAALGLKAPLATVGAELPGGMRIKPAKLRGVPSSGMLCSAVELGLAEAQEGLMTLPEDAPTGASLEEWLGLGDTCLEVDLTPNRGDCLSVLGVAREVSVLTGAALCAPEPTPVSATSDRTLAVHLEAGGGCPRYVGRLIEGVDAARPTPHWMVERLRRSGVRSISALVDITNYVLLELGQPMHAFDADKLIGDIRVRPALAGEKILRLDASASELAAGTLVIADDTGPVAIAGVMGGEATAVSATTKTVFLESAHFTQAAMAGVARRLKLHTDASHRFERGVDFELPVQACERATALVLEICGGRPGPTSETTLEAELPTRTMVTLRAERLARVLGFEVAGPQVARILSGLGFGVQAADGGWQCTPPSHRFDIAIEEDLIEEVVRVHGYHQIPARRPRAEGRVSARNQSRARLMLACDLLRARDYAQAVTYSFIPETHATWIAPDLFPLPLSNPISSEMAVMRPSIWPGLLASIQHNQNRQVGRVRLFEHGQVFRCAAEGAATEQVQRLSGAVCGRALPDQWSTDGRLVDFFDVKADVESVLHALGHSDISMRAASHPALHPGQSAQVVSSGQVCGWLGKLHPELKSRFDLRADCFLFDLSLDTLLAEQPFEYRQASRFPAVRRDLAVVVGEQVTLFEVEQSIRGAAGAYLRDLQLFDVYRGQGIDSGSKSLALGLIFQASSSTLTDEVVDAAVAAVVAALNQDVGGILRD